MLRALILVSLAAFVQCDLPINCRYEDVIGTWNILESERTGDSSLKCKTLDGVEVAYNKTFKYSYPNLVEDEIGNFGTWTLIYNQGFETNINGRSYWSPFFYTFSEYSCDVLSNGWSTDVTSRNWGCYTGQKMDTAKMEPEMRKFVKPTVSKPNEKYVNDHQLIRKINAAKTSWTAKAYPQHEKYTNYEMFLRGGGQSYELPPVSPATKEQKARIAALPENFDWSNVTGINYVSQVKDQDNCGSCYAFASIAAAEARVRIATDNERQDLFSEQDIVSCSLISEGCNGGFSYLVGGRYGFEQGFAPSECNGYTQSDEVCDTDPSCPRTYVSEYEYLGGYYGAANEELMMEALVNNGPLPVGFEVQNDFYSYSGGVYQATGLKADFDPFVTTNHAVLLVGYGVDEVSGLKFWRVKNSWGRVWGEGGFFKIIRGTNEVGIESMPVDFTVIP